MKLDSKLNSLTTPELIDYILKFETDPVLLKLARLIDDNSILNGLYDIGMGQDGFIQNAEYDYMLPHELIKELECRNDMLQTELSEAEEKLDKLEIMTVTELISSLETRIRISNIEIHRLKEIADSSLKKESEMKSKLDTWTILNNK